MKTTILKPVTPKAHGIIDYVFSGLQLLGPLCLGLNKKTIGTYAALGAGFLAVNALTDTPVGVKRRISFKGHQRADAGFLSGLALLTTCGFIRREKKARLFHIGFLAAAVAHYVLTDYNAEPDAD